MGIEGLTLTEAEKTFIVDNNIGGIILFRRNVEGGAEQVRDLCASIQELRHKMRDKAPFTISIDMEGGRVHRLRPPFTQFPALAHVGKIDSTSVAFRFAQMMGDELRAVGINLDFAPSIDIFSNPANTVIGDRALGTTAEPVGRLGSALVRGYIKAGVIPCAKHFPGHGDTLIDSHHGLPVEQKTLEELEAFELEPFKKVIRARLDLIMAAHIRYPKIDPEWPATLSEIFLKKLLREKMRYRELIITDDLDMGALKQNYPKPVIAVRALKAGCNILLYCNETDSPPIAIDAVEKAVRDGELELSVVEDNCARMLNLKKANLAHPEPKSMSDVSRIVGHPDHLRLAQSILAGSVPADLLNQTT